MQREAEFSSLERFNSNLSGMFVVRLRISSSIPDYSKNWVEGAELCLPPRVGPQLRAVFNSLPYLSPLNSNSIQRPRSARNPPLEVCSHFLTAFESQQRRMLLAFRV